MQEKLRGETLLKVVAIMVIVLGAFTIVGGVGIYSSSSLIVSMFELTTREGEIYKIIGAVTIVTGIIFIVIGIICSKLRKNAESSIAIIILAIVQVVSVIICGMISANLYAVIQEQILKTAALGIPSYSYSIPLGPLSFICIALSVLMIIGAILNKYTKPIAVEPISYKN